MPSSHSSDGVTTVAMCVTSATMSQYAALPARSTDLVRAPIERFLEHYCDRPLVPARFRQLVAGSETGVERLATLAQVAGLTEVQFLDRLLAAIRSRGADHAGPVLIGGVELPYQLLVYVAGALSPDSACETVARVDRLEELLAVTVADDQRANLQRVIDTFPVRWSRHLCRQMRFSPAIARQYRPLASELEGDGAEHTWVGQLQHGIVEQMYPNRVILLLSNACPAYCRFCFRKHREQRSQPPPDASAVAAAIAYIGERPEVEEVLITGGDPFLRRATLRNAIAALAGLPHVHTLRLATRAVSYDPAMLKDWLPFLITTQDDLLRRGKRIELATHFVHPDEISIDSLHVISHLRRHGVPVYVQTPLLAGCNDNGELVELFSALRAAGAELHYVFMPSHPVRGNEAYATSIARGLETARYLRAHLSDRAMPRFATPTSIGKIDWATSGWAVAQRDARSIWLRTPYSRDYFRSFADDWQATDRVRTNAEGGLDVALDAAPGDHDVFGDCLTPSAPAPPPAPAGDAIASLQSDAARDQRLLDVHIGPRLPGLARPHIARVELDADVTTAELTNALAYLGEQPDITDVAVARADDVMHDLDRVLEVVARVQQHPHVAAVRLRSLDLVSDPDRVTPATVKRLAELNRLGVVRPCRLEVETQILHASQIDDRLRAATVRLARAGITVVTNIPLLAGINDHGTAILAITSGCRRAGIEVGNLLVAGLPLQGSVARSVTIGQVVDIASHVRRHESGRAVPRYLVRTRLGEIDFSVAPSIFVCDREAVRVRMRPHDLATFRSIDPEFEWPADVTIDAGGHPLVPVCGLTFD